jgi:DNA mismatch repair protein MutS
MIYDDYIEYTREYEGKYGERTLVLMEVGSFFEIYAVRNDAEQAGPDIYAIGDLLNLQVSRKNKSILENSRANPLMAGFPSHALAKHTQALLAAGWTVVLVRQVTPPPIPRREVTEVLSPGMQLQPSGAEGNYLMVAHWDTHGPRAELLAVGVACVDVSTGETFAYEVAASAGDPNLALDEMVRLYQTYQPRETVLLGTRLSEDQREQVETAMGVRYDGTRCVHRLWRTEVAPFAKLSYQNEVLRKAFPDCGMLTPIEALQLERLDNARVAFSYMIQFGYEHSEAVIRRLRPPAIHEPQGRCTLEYNSAVQLNVLAPPGSSDRPLLAWLNRCATAFGARRFRERLLQPVSDVARLRERYDRIEAMLDSGTFRSIHKTLREVMDLERMGRRMRLGTFSPMEWVGFHASLTAIREALAMPPGGEDSISHDVAALVGGYESDLSLDDCAKYLLQDIKGNVFCEGAQPSLDGLAREHGRAWGLLHALASRLEGLGAGDAACRVEHNDRDGYVLTTTKRRFQAIQQELRQLAGPLVLEAPDGTGECVEDAAALVAKPVSASSTSVRLTHPWIQAKSDAILRHTAQLQLAVTKAYRAFVATYAEAHAERLERVIQYVAELDVCATNALNAHDYRYTRPALRDAGPDEPACVTLRDMRHPILERILEHEMYVPNDIHLEAGSEGLLLFGVNASGKSSLMKAVGLNVLMAQAGMYVAAGHMELAPYTHIFTRIAGMDNLFKGWSTFTVEMMELRNILQRCDHKSLVLGDELCSGTEAISALAIVAAGIETLREAGASFIFATHLHDLCKLRRVREVPGVQMRHMHVEIDAHGRIRYDRKLRDGSGDALYGLEVCKGLGLPRAFLKVAHQVRCELQGVPEAFQSAQRSRYNGEVRMHECRLCGAAATETHHIVPQKAADAQGYIGHFHKDRGFNLVPLCEACHEEVHHGSLVIHGYERTDEGVVLRTERREPTADKVQHPETIKNKIRWAHDTWWVKRTARSGWRAQTGERAEAAVTAELATHFGGDLERAKATLHDPSMPWPTAPRTSRR